MSLMNIQYSSNLEDTLDIGSLMSAMHDVAQGAYDLKVGTLRTSAIPVNNFLVADCDPENGFIHIALKFKGRDKEQIRRVGEAVFGALEDYLAAFYDTIPIEYSVELVHMDAWSKGNIREKIRRESRKRRQA